MFCILIYNLENNNYFFTTSVDELTRINILTFKLPCLVEFSVNKVLHISMVTGRSLVRVTVNEGERSVK